MASYANLSICRWDHTPGSGNCGHSPGSNDLAGVDGSRDRLKLSLERPLLRQPLLRQFGSASTQARHESQSSQTKGADVLQCPQTQATEHDQGQDGVGE